MIEWGIICIKLKYGQHQLIIYAMFESLDGMLHKCAFVAGHLRHLSMHMQAKLSSACMQKE